MKSPFTFIWNINNFNMLLPKYGCYIDSPNFNIVTMESTKAYIRLYPAGYEREGYVDSCLHIINEESLPVDCLVKLSYISCCPAVNHISAEYNAKKASDDLFPLLADRSEIFRSRKSFFPNGIFTIECEIKERDCSSLLSEKQYGETVVEIKQHRIDLTEFFRASSSKNNSNPEIEYTKVILYQRQEEDSSYEFRISVRLQSSTDTKKDYLIEVSKLDESLSPINTAMELTMLCDASPILIMYDERFFPKSKENQNLLFQLSEDQIRSLQSVSSSLYFDFKVSEGGVITYLEDLEVKKLLDTSHEKFPGLILERIYKNQQFSDVTLQVGSDQYSVNKCILAAASPVFKAMLENDMQESKTNIINIKDIDSDTIHEMIKFLYTGTVGKFEFNMVSNIYSAADKYQILELKSLCSLLIVDNMSAENICEVLELADLHSDQEMAEKARYFLVCNHKTVINSHSWENFMARKVDLAAKLMFQIISHQC